MHSEPTVRLVEYLLTRSGAEGGPRVGPIIAEIIAGC